MSSEKSNLSELLNENSFILWVKGDGILTESEKEKWDQWLSSDEQNKHLLKKAKKIIEMPFKEAEVDCDSGELARLKEAIRKREKNNPD